MNRAVFIVIIFVLNPGFVFSQSIVNTVHNLSVSGSGTIKATSESEICIFCHTPHNSSPRQPLWNRPDPGSNYTLYNSSTIQASPGQPDGASALCLSCHDGTIALGNVISRSSPISFSSGVRNMPGGQSNLGTDISDDHPVSFVYNSTVAAADGELVDPAGLNGFVALEGDKMQCTSCHDPHRNNFGDFLVVSTRNSDLCLYCHQKSFWNSSRHRTSGKRWNGSGIDPWPHSPYATVSENACENCHNPHSAEGHKRLLNYQTEENNCLNCHNGNVATKDIQAVLSRQYTHDVYNYTQIHDTDENSVVQNRHVECEDCHNPHSSRNASAQAPAASGLIDGVRGVNSDGNAVSEIQYQYELCYRCHADSPDKPVSSTSRVIEQNNVLLEFDLTNPSYHPVEGAGKNSNVPSLISPYRESSVIYCTDCHASDGAGSPRGPHGSIYPQILKYNFNRTGNAEESFQAYELCYQCHDRDTIIKGDSNVSKDVHDEHVRGENISCNACHDPHGISSSQGNSTNNTHLINFDAALVSPDPNSGRLEFVDQGNDRGSCYLVCHGENHGPEDYGN